MKKVRTKQYWNSFTMCLSILFLILNSVVSPSHLSLSTCCPLSTWLLCPSCTCHSTFFLSPSHCFSLCSLPAPLSYVCQSLSVTFPYMLSCSLPASLPTCVTLSSSCLPLAHVIQLSPCLIPTCTTLCFIFFLHVFLVLH